MSQSNEGEDMENDTHVTVVFIFVYYILSVLWHDNSNMTITKA